MLESTTTYCFRCLLPNNRLLSRLEDTRVVALHTDGNDEDSSDSENEKMSREHGFIYVTRLHFMHEADLRNYHAWGLDGDAGFADSREMGIDHLLNAGQIASGLAVRKLPDVGGVNVGYGLFADSGMASGGFIAEYVGVLYAKRHTAPSAYSMFYPSYDGAYEVDAAEYGNVCRFVNHSSTRSNAAYKHVLHEGVVHVVCIAIADIAPAEQILVDYGASYWHARGIQPVDLS